VVTRINQEHRLVCRVSSKSEAQALEVAQCRYHY
jgi:toxin YoeB